MFEYFSAILGVLVAIGTIVNTSLILRDRAKEPISELKKQVEEQEKRIDELERTREKDNERIEDLERMQRVTLKSLRALLAHGISGNNSEEMIKAKSELDEYLDTR